MRAALEQSVASLRRQRDFSAFPAARRAVLERVTGFVESNDVDVRRYVSRFLHGKAYIVGELNDDGVAGGPGAALVSSANLTQGGLVGNLELGMVHYQPNVVEMALGWYERLWDEAQDFKDDLLELLRPSLRWRATPRRSSCARCWSCTGRTSTPATRRLSWEAIR